LGPPIIECLVAVALEVNYLAVAAAAVVVAVAVVVVVVVVAAVVVTVGVRLVGLTSNAATVSSSFHSLVQKIWAPANIGGFLAS